MKRGLILSLLLGIFLIGFVSAFGHSNFRSFLDQSLMIYGGLFVLFFALIIFILKKTILKESKATRVVISFILATFATYGLAVSEIVTRMDTSSLGDFPLGDFLPTIMTIVFVIGLIYFIAKWGFGKLFTSLGIIFFSISFTDLVYEKDIFFMGGIVFLFLGLIFLWRARRKKKQYGEPETPGDDPSPKKGETRRDRAKRRRQEKIARRKEKERRGQIAGRKEKERRRSIKRNFNYRSGMRRGGMKSTRTRFVSKAATTRYARRFGAAAAKKRFGKSP